MFNYFDEISENVYFNVLNNISIEDNENLDNKFNDENFRTSHKNEENNKDNLEECHIIYDIFKTNNQNEITAKSTSVEENSKDLNNNSLNQKNELLGKKRNNSKINKLSDNYLKRRCKNLVFDNLFDFINNKINIVYKGNIGQGRLIKKLLHLNQEQKSNGDAKFNKNLINKSLKEILSENISSKFTNYSPYHNKNLIDLLIDENKSKNAEYFKRLFSLKFSECLKHFNGSENFKELEGMNTFDSLKSQIRKREGNDYLQALNCYITNFENIIFNKRERKTKEEKLLGKGNIE